MEHLIITDNDKTSQFVKTFVLATILMYLSGIYTKLNTETVCIDMSALKT